MDSDQTWAAFWLLCVGVVATAAVVINSANNTWMAGNAKIISEMVKAGADPLKAQCAIYNDQHADLCLATLIK